MTGDQATDRRDIAQLAAMLMIVVVALFDASSLRGLYGDGSNFLYHLLRTKDFVHANPSRLCTEWLTQFPVVLALRAGVVDLPALILLHSATLVLMPVALWVLALARLHRDPAFWLAFLLFCIVYFNVGFFAIGEYNLAYALVALALAILTGKARIGLGWAVVALLAGLGLLAAYEAMLYLGPLLVLTGVLRLWKRSELPAVRALLLFGILAYAAGTGVAVCFVVNPGHPEQLAAAMAFFAAMHNRLLALSVAFAIGWIALSTPVAWLRRGGFFLAIACLVGLVLPANWSLPHQHYEARTLVGLALFGLGGLLALRFVAIARWPALVRVDRRAPIVALLFFVALAVSNMAYSLDYRAYLALFRNEVRSRSGLVAVEDTRLLDGRLARYGWIWAYPLMSLLLREKADQAIILNPRDYRGYEPFEVKDGVPDLGEYYRPGR
ncbi:hypothetical protein GG804_11480 [Sphingomonas histidinilytica]|uniref:Glycosyltransferase RgtA/B/C/D-like domain-containing protein n=1 Tax=Rhizorhabdus histidinilytica TaxID=439228 RepID=A0A1T5BL33_9SPHN|nr:hypothetical protein [Rhizorhabdus histidinilytica]MBO9377389.1 hypothetical protein [Rhizorhabdus histidinilytica]SKB47769.1 hypothetical protein SAMN06295920_10381 [Rhizorhabdus histidinilytica]